MKQLFLTSSVHAVAHDIAKKVNLNKGNKLIFIDTAAEDEEGDKQWLEDDMQALINAGFEVTRYTITGKTKDTLNSDLVKYDYIYVSGGNTFFLLQESQKSGFNLIIKDLIENKGKTYIGTSAGSIIAGPDTYPAYRLDGIEKAPELKGYKGYGLVNFCIMPHWGSEHFKELYLNKRLAHAYKDDQVPLIMLTDNQYAYIHGNDMRIIDVRKEISHKV